MPGLIHDTPEHRAVRESVAKIAGRYGPAYFLERACAGEDIDELWRDLGAAGLLGVHLPEEYGGGGGGMAEAVVVVEELSAHGMPMLIWVISPAIVGSIRKRGSQAGVAAGHCRRFPQGRLRAHRAGRRLQQSQRHHDRAPGRRRLGDLGRQVPHLGHRPMRRGAASDAGRGPVDAGPKAAVDLPRADRRGRAVLPADPD